MKRKILSLLAIAFVHSIPCVAQNKKNYILNENFDANTIGWVEESTEAHKIEIKDGLYYIYSFDTSKTRSSAGPRNLSFFWNMPKGFEIIAAFQNIDQATPPHFGIILRSSTLEYEFSFSHTNTGEVTEWDYNRDSEVPLFSRVTDKKIELNRTQIIFKIKVADSHFEFYVNEEMIGHGQFNAKSWEDIRLFTTSGSAVKIDYLRIQKN